MRSWLASSRALASNWWSLRRVRLSVVGMYGKYTAGFWAAVSARVSTPGRGGRDGAREARRVRWRAKTGSRRQIGAVERSGGPRRRPKTASSTFCDFSSFFSVNDGRGAVSSACLRRQDLHALAWLAVPCRAMACLGLAWLGLAWLGLAWLGLAWLGLAWLGLAWLGLACLAWLGLALAWLGLAWLAWLGLACVRLTQLKAVPAVGAAHHRRGGGRPRSRSARLRWRRSRG